MSPPHVPDYTGPATEKQKENVAAFLEIHDKIPPELTDSTDSFDRRARCWKPVRRAERSAAGQGMQFCMKSAKNLAALGTLLQGDQNVRAYRGMSMLFARGVTDVEIFLVKFVTMLDARSTPEGNPS